MKSNVFFMQAAINEAYKSLKEGGIPIGSVLVYHNSIISKGHNQRIQKNSPILHAEMDCINNAGRLLKKDYIKCILYSTLTPCQMCAATIDLYKIPKVIAINSDYKPKYCHSFDIKYIENFEYLTVFVNFINKNKKLWKEDIGE